MMQLAVCAEMQFLDLPFIERVIAIADRGFDVELWDWTRKDLAAIAATGANISSMTGYVRGDLISDDGIEQILATASRSLEAASVIDAARLNLHGTGLGPDGLPVRPTSSVSGKDWVRAADTLTRLADLAAAAERVFTLENLNTAVDHPGTPFASAADTVALVETVDHPHLRLNLDLYHAQIGEGNLTDLVRHALPLVGEIQVADVPGRCEPGTGEVNYRSIALELAALGYDGVVALEAWAKDDSEAALDTFRSTFTIPG